MNLINLKKSISPIAKKLSRRFCSLNFLAFLYVFHHSFISPNSCFANTLDRKILMRSYREDIATFSSDYNIFGAFYHCLQNYRKLNSKASMDPSKPQIQVYLMNILITRMLSMYSKILMEQVREPTDFVEEIKNFRLKLSISLLIFSEILFKNSESSQHLQNPSTQNLVEVFFKTYSDYSTLLQDSPNDYSQLNFSRIQITKALLDILDFNFRKTELSTLSLNQGICYLNSSLNVYHCLRTFENFTINTMRDETYFQFEKDFKNFQNLFSNPCSEHMNSYFSDKTHCEQIEYQVAQWIEKFIRYFENFETYQKKGLEFKFYFNSLRKNLDELFSLSRSLPLIWHEAVNLQSKIDQLYRLFQKLEASESCDDIHKTDEYSISYSKFQSKNRPNFSKNTNDLDLESFCKTFKKIIDSNKNQEISSITIRILLIKAPFCKNRA